MSSERARRIAGTAEPPRWLSADREDALARVRPEGIHRREDDYPKSALTTTTEAATPARSARSPAGSAWR